jgi:hypothetical protein
VDNCCNTISPLVAGICEQLHDGRVHQLKGRRNEYDYNQNNLECASGKAERGFANAYLID